MSRRDRDTLTLCLCPARATGAGTPTDLALRLEAHRGYDAALPECCRAELTTSRGQTGDRSRRHAAAVSSTAPVRFSTPVLTGHDTADLDALFVEPAVLGRRMLRSESDPGAVGFYLKAGAIADREPPVTIFPRRGPAGP